MPSILACLSLAAVVITAAAQSDDSALVSQLITANSQVTRIGDLKQDSEFVFDFNKAKPGAAQGGFVSAADVTTFPALQTGDGGMVVGVLGPCGCNSPHTHPRATEIQILLKGGPVMVQTIQENGARTITNTIHPGEATVFPLGSLHYQQNMGCEPTVFVASFDHRDAGTLSGANSLFALDRGVLSATLGVEVKMLENITLPTNFILGAQECLDRCKINRDTFNFNATFKDYQAFSNSSWPSVSGSAGQGSASTTGSPLSNTNSASTNNVAGFLADADGNVAIQFGENPLRHAVIGLSVTSAALLIALLSMSAIMAYRRRSGVKVAPRGFASGFAPSTGRGYPYVTPYDDAEVLSSRHSIEKA